MQVLKYRFPRMGMQKMNLPRGADILSIQTQYDTPTMWCMVDPLAEMAPRTFFLAVTGEDLPAVEIGGILEYLGTGQRDGGTFVYHVFEVW